MTTLLIASDPGFASSLARELESREGHAPTVLFHRTRTELPPPVLPMASHVGDLGAIDFGLGRVDYSALVQTVERVVVALTPERATSDDIERSRHVRISSEVLEFVKSGGGRKGVTFLSSLLIFGDATGPVAEADFRLGQSFSGVDEEILAVSEKIVRRVHEHCPLKILRGEDRSSRARALSSQDFASRSDRGESRARRVLGREWPA